jgi:hypothetical protein
MRTLLSVAAVAVCIGVLGCDPTAYVETDKSGEGNDQVANVNADPVASFKSILYSENELASRSFQTDLIGGKMKTIAYVPNSLVFDVKETDSLRYKYQADLEFTATDGSTRGPHIIVFRFLYDGSDWRATEWTTSGKYRKRDNLSEFIYDDYGKGYLGIAVKNVK